MLVKQLFNKGDNISMTNFRLISLLNVFFKVSETAMHSKLSCHLHDNSILATLQHSFRKKISTENAVFRLTKTILKSINQEMHVAGIFCDLAKAFNCMNQDFFYLNDISMEFEECLKTGSGPI